MMTDRLASVAISNATTVQRLVGYYEVVMSAFAVGSMAGIVIIMNVEIFYRYVLNDSLIWADAICRYLMVWMTFFLLGPAFQKGEFITVEFLVRSLPNALQLMTKVIAYLGSIALLLIVAYYGYHFASMNAIQTVPAFDFIASAIYGHSVSSNVSMYWIYLSIPVGCLILAGHILLAIIDEIGRHRFRRVAIQP